MIQESNITALANVWEPSFHTIASFELSDSKQSLQTRMTIIFAIIYCCRNPYERLVSAYNDKALSRNGLYTKRYHNPCSWLNISYNTTLTFPQFVDCIIKKAEKHSRTRGRTGNALPQSTTISSRSAAIWLDMHWVPQSHLSLPCRVDYNLMGKYDRFRDNSKFMIHRLGLNATLSSNNNHKNKSNMTLDDWYDKLSIVQLKKLKEFYKYDFLLFGFDSNPPGSHVV